MNGVVYAILYGELLIKEAEIKDRPSNGLYKHLTFARFKDNGYTMVNWSPGEVYNDAVWLPVRDDRLAVNLLLDYQDDQIAELQKKFENRENNIKMLEECFKKEEF